MAHSISGGYGVDMPRRAGKQDQQIQALAKQLKIAMDALLDISMGRVRHPSNHAFKALNEVENVEVEMRQSGVFPHPYGLK